MKSDFSAFSLFTAGLACLAPFTAAYTQPKGKNPEGNPLTQPGLNSVVPAGKEFTVTWRPTTKGTVTLVLLKGPSTDAEPLYPIVQGHPNDGVFVWTPKLNLQPSDPSEPAEGYGIQLIDDATGQYQYTTQFGISNPDYSKYESSSSAAKPTGYEHSSTKAPSYHTTSAPAYHHTPSNLPKPTWYTTKDHNVTMVAPTYSIPTMSISASSVPVPSSNSSASTSAPAYQGSAASLSTGVFGLLFTAAIAVLAL